MRDGRFVEVATPEALWNAPRTIFAAQFLGGANILAGEAQHASGGAIVQTAFGVLRTTHVASGPVSVFVRPENVSLVPPGEGPNRFSCALVGQRFQGDTRNLELRLPNGGPVLRSRTRTGALPAGGAVTIEILPEHVEVLREGDR
jgi:ABC-type Fe3+/spermidine/putrescine transport system ATPase subunit